MFRNYLKTTVRNLLRQKSFSLINLAGLTLGIVCALVIFLIIRFELNYDSYHDDADRIYRLVRQENEFGKISHSPGVPFPLPEAFKADFPEVESMSIVNRNFSATVVAVEKSGAVRRFGFDDAGVSGFLAGLFVVVTLCAGIYPALHLSGYNPVETIRNKLSHGYGQGLSLRKGLVVVQIRDFAGAHHLRLCDQRPDVLFGQC